MSSPDVSPPPPSPAQTQMQRQQTQLMAMQMEQMQETERLQALERERIMEQESIEAAREAAIRSRARRGGAGEASLLSAPGRGGYLLGMTPRDEGAGVLRTYTPPPTPAALTGIGGPQKKEKRKPQGYWTLGGSYHETQAEAALAMATQQAGMENRRGNVVPVW